MKLDKHVVDMFTELTKPADDVKMEKTCYGTISVVDGTRYVKLDGSDLLVPAASTVKTSHGDRVTVLMKNHSLTVTGNLTAPATDGEGGSSGEAGTAATIEVGTVTTGEAGSSAMVTNVGTTSAAIFDFVIPRGDKGEKGDTGTWDGTIPDHEHTISDITDFPTSLPANGGNAETVGGYSSDHILKHVTRLTSTDCNDITKSGWYSFNGCSGHAPGSNSTIASGTYFILLNIPMTAPGYFVQVATFIHGSVNYLGKTYIRHCNNGVWTEWGNIADGGNAAMLDGYGKSLFFKWIADKNANDDCNDCTESGWYFFNGCKDHSPVNNGAMGAGGYFFLLTYRYNDSYIAQTAMYVHGTATHLGKTYTRYCNGGTWSDWVNIADGGNADTLDGLHANEIASNPGLLINPDFKINQRGKSKYTAAGYTVDRWAAQSNCKVTPKSSGGVRLDCLGTVNTGFYQPYDGDLSGNTVTLSLKVSGSGSLRLGVWGTSIKTVTLNDTPTVYSHTFELGDDVNFGMWLSANGEYAEIEWAKLEIGSIATPFCPPNPATELLKIQAMDGTIPAATVNGRHGGRIPTQNASGKYWNENSTDINDAFIQWDGSTYFKLKTVGRNLTMVDNADTLDGKHADEFLYADGFAGQIEKLFRDVDTTDDLSSLFSIVPDDANLNDLNPGIYAVTTSAARESLGIPKEGWAAGPSPSSKEAMQTPGGILIKFGRVFGGPNLVMDPVDREFPGNLTDACAFFITNNSVIYHTSTTIKQAVNGGDPTISWKSWTVFLSNNWNCSDQIIINSIKYISMDVTVASGGIFVMYPIQQMWNYPYTSGVAYGPTRTYPLVLNDNRSALVIKNTSSSNLVLPAGRYLIRLR